MEMLSAVAVFGSGFIILGLDVFLLVLLLKEHRRVTAAHVLAAMGYVGDAAEKLTPEKKDKEKEELHLRDEDFLGNHAP
jgi:hypothetical protein